MFKFRYPLNLIDTFVQTDQKRVAISSNDLVQKEERMYCANKANKAIKIPTVQCI